MIKIKQRAGYLVVDIISDIFKLCGKAMPEVTDGMDTEHDDVIRTAVSQLQQLLASTPYKQLTPIQTERLTLLIEEMETAL